MKGFSRGCVIFSLCGLNCGLCAMRVGGYCPGCGGGEGNQSCRFARCAMGRGAPEFCSDCAEYPCALYEGFDDSDSFVPHSRRAADLKIAQELGLEAYLAALSEKMGILDELLGAFNDGRRKTLFCTAAYLLPLPELRCVMSELRAAAQLPVKERAALASERLNGAAAQLGLSLKLRKAQRKGR